jgi:hypothetical protein
MKKRYIALMLLVVISASSASALQIEGVTVPPQTTVHGTTLSLNGAGLRTFKLLMVPVKVYVAALYTPSPLRTPQEVTASPGPMQFDFTFLRAVGQSDVTTAWTQQFSHSVSYTYPGYEKDRDAFIAMFGPLALQGVERVKFVGTNTIVIDQGVKKGVIAGRNFQQAFLSLWFGSKPVSKKLRAALLGN